MALQLENLDNKTFNEFVDEAIKRIPLYAPDWTDHNIHDPGIMLIELFAWLADMQIYSVNRIPEATYKKLLKLLGIHSYNTYKAAEVPVSHTITEDTGMFAYVLDKATKVYAINEKTGEQTVFSSREPMYVVRTNIEALLTYKADTNQYIAHPVDTMHTGEYSFYPFDSIPVKQDMFYIGLSKNTVNIALNIGFHSAYARKIVDDTVAYTKPEIISSIIIVWEYYDGANWQTLDINDQTANLRESAIITFTLPPDMQNSVIEGRDCSWIRCRIVEGTYERPPKLSMVVVNTGMYHQCEVFRNQVFSSPALPDFTIELGRMPLLKERWSSDMLSVAHFWEVGRVSVNHGGDEWKIWENVVGIHRSGPDDTHYCVDYTNGKIYFGDGNMGMIPPGDTKNITVVYVNYTHKITREITYSSYGAAGFIIDMPEKLAIVEDDAVGIGYVYEEQAAVSICIKDKNGVWNVWENVDDLDASGIDDRHFVVDYHTGTITFGNGVKGKIPAAGSNNIIINYVTGGGPAGNVGAHTVDRLEGPLDRVIALDNYIAAKGGTLAQTLPESMARAKRDLKKITRAITADDYEKIVLNAPELCVARARALPGYHPNHPVAVPGIVTVVVVPDTEYVRHIPGDDYLQSVYQYLDQYRMLTTELFVISPEYVEITVAAAIVVKENYIVSATRERVNRALQTFLHPVTGGGKGTGWEFGRSVHVSEIYELIDTVEGVDYIESLQLKKDGKTMTGNIKIPAYCLVYSGSHTIS